MWPGQAWRVAAHAVLVSACATGIVLIAPAARPSPDPAYTGVGAGLVVGALLWVRLRPGEAGTTLLIVPCIVAEVRFGLAATAAVGFAAVVANLVRGTRAAASLASGGNTTLAYLAGELAAREVAADVIPRVVAFAVAFVLAQLLLGRVATLLVGRGLQDRRVERPDAVTSLALAPLAALPLLAYARFGDGGLLLGLAALLAMLALVAEARNLATARAETEDERDRLARANAIQRDLVQLITHELKNPLTSVLAYAQLVERGLQQQRLENLPTHVGRIRVAATALQRLVDDLLQLSRLEDTGELPPFEPVDIDSLARTVVADLEPIAERKRQTLELELPEPLGTVSAPPLLLRQALSNLVSNAIKYTPADGRVVVWARNLDDTNRVVLGVTDTGIGLSEQDLARLFSKFFRSSDARARAEPGSGLGLALTHAIISRMGGQVEAESKIDVGSTFRIVLPRRRS